MYARFINAWIASIELDDEIDIPPEEIEEAIRIAREKKEEQDKQTEVEPEDTYLCE